jgi:UDPglucose 6-dehydrogenase
MQVAVFGAGYVGLVTGAVLAELGHRVTVIEVVPEKIEKIRRGQAPIYEHGLDAMLTRVIASGRFTVTDRAHEAVEAAEVVFIAVGTPPLASGEADLRYVRQAALAIGQGLGQHRRQVVVNKATVPIGSANQVEVWIEDGYGGKPPSDAYTVASNPEFLREGTAIFDTLYPDRIVLGADKPWALEQLKALYQPILQQSFTPPPEVQRPPGLSAVPLVETDRISAEMIKYAANAFLATKISFANEIANVCERVGADVTEVARGIGLDSRIGPRFLNAGAGWGGSCFGKDLSALIYTAEEYGYHPQLLHSTVSVNRDQRHRIVSRLQDALKTIKGRRVALWGLAFKPGTDDLRDAPSLTVIQELLRLGARIHVYDPVAMATLKRDYPDLDVVYADAPLGALTDAEALIVMTEWPDFAKMPLSTIAATLARPVLIDGRNLWHPEAARAAGLTYHGVGRS